MSPYRVLDLTEGDCLLAGHLLAQLGMDVVQIEPLGGSSARHTGKAGPGGAPSLVWSAEAAGKRGVALAYDTPSGREALLALVGQADILIESAAPGAMQDLGLGHDVLRRANPRLIHVSITPFGSDGPKAHYAATDLTVWASSGAVWPHRGPDGVPLRMSASQAFRQACIDAVGGALIALHARGPDGSGQHVDISSQASCMLCTLSSHLAMAVGHDDFNALGGAMSSKLLDLSGSGARTRKTKWRLKDGLLEMHIGMGVAAGRNSNALFKWIGELTDCPQEFLDWDWTQMPELLLSGTLTADDLNRARAFVAPVLERFTKAEILAIAQERGLLMAPVLTTEDLLASEQLAARGFFAPVADSGHVLPAPFMTKGALRPAPELGEHNREVFAEWLGVPAKENAL